MDSIFSEVKISLQHTGLSMALDSSFEENYLYAWTTDLNFENEPNQANASAISPNAPSTSGEKRAAWDDDKEESQRKKVAKKQEKADSSESDNLDSEMPMWNNETIDMPTSFDGSLSVLGTSNFSLNETLLQQKHSLTTFKEEVLAGGSESSPFLTNEDENLESPPNDSDNSQDVNEQDSRFQYVLAAATSIASKAGDETLTYLNQGQSYGIKLKKVGDLLRFKGKRLKSIIRVQFHERRLQYIEKEQILAWQASRPGERILELDVPLSYGLFDVEHDEMVNSLSFCWDPTQEVGAYIKVNSISTEFTAKKHGGEKGVPFRIQVETFIQGSSQRLHAAACQIRVFKLKGADRKHKQEREKWAKLPENERLKYQLPYESTILTDIPLDTLPLVHFEPPSPKVEKNAVQRTPPAVVSNLLPSLTVELPKVGENSTTEQFQAVSNEPANENEQVSADLTRDQMSKWLIRNGFEMLATTFAHFNGADMLRLTRNDLIHMCGLPDGVRLYYAIRARPAVSLCLYVNLPGQQYFNAIYLSQSNRSEFMNKLAQLMGVGVNSIVDLFALGPQNIHVQLSDEFVRNLANESTFSVDVLRSNGSDRCCLLLKPILPN